MKIKTMHLILICYIDRVGHIVKLERLVKSCKVPYVMVRGKMDMTSPQADRAAMWAEEKTKITGHLCFVSAHTGEGIEDLKAVAKELSSVQL